MLRPIAVQRYLAVMQARGMPTDCILAGSGIDEAKLGRSDFLAESWQCRVVVDNLLRVSGDNGIGFDVGLNTTLLDLGIVGHAAITCRTMRETHRLWEQYGMALSGVMGLLKIIQERRDRVTLAFANQSMSDSLLRFYAEETLGMLHMIGNPLVGELPAVMEATFAYRAPQHAHRYRELLQCPIHFDSGVSTITIDRRWFEKNVRTYDAEFNKLCWNHCGEVLHRIESEQAIVARLRGIFMNYVGSTPQIEEAARELNISARTLRRRLLEIGTTYRAQIDAYRMEQAKAYLKRPEVSPKEVGFQLGFIEPSAFRRAFKAWTGQTIGEYRSQALQFDSRQRDHH